MATQAGRGGLSTCPYQKEDAMKRMIFIAETRPDNQVIRQESTPIPASDAAADNADNNASIRGESGRGEVRDDVDVDDIAMLLRGGDAGS